MSYKIETVRGEKGKVVRSTEYSDDKGWKGVIATANERARKEKKSPAKKIKDTKVTYRKGNPLKRFGHSSRITVYLNKI